MMKAILASFFAAAAMTLTPITAQAAEDEIYTSWRNDLAIGGYDAVSFFAGKPLQGRADFSTRYKDSEWRFDTQANLDLFLTNPTAFEPQYGGYCAWAVARGKLAPGRPEHWHVEDGKLYLNYNKRVKKRWDSRRADFIAAGDARWPAILED